LCLLYFFFFFSSRRRHTRSYGDWSSDVCSSDLRSCARRWRSRWASQKSLPVRSRHGDPDRRHLARVIRRRAARSSRKRSHHNRRSEERRVGKEWRTRWWEGAANEKDERGVSRSI